MQVTTIDEARAMVGRTFERDGKCRRLDHVGETGVIWFVGREYLAWEDIEQAGKWLSKATEVTE